MLVDYCYSYSLGLGIPFALLAVGAKHLLVHVKKIYPYMTTIKACGGILIVLMGCWMIFNQIKEIQIENRANMVNISAETLPDATRVDFTLQDINGETVTLSDFKGKDVYIKFWATWCPSCLGGLEDFASLAKQYEDSEEVAILSIVAPEFRGEMSKDDFVAWAKGQGLAFPILLDETDSVNKAFQIKGYPSAVIIDKAGAVYKKMTGEKPIDDIKEILSDMQ